MSTPTPIWLVEPDEPHHRFLIKQWRNGIWTPVEIFETADEALWFVENPY